MRCGTRLRRPGAAAVELAVLLPLLAFLFVIGVDFARVFKHTLTLTNCARSGALYGSEGPTRSLDDAGIRAAALADAGDFSPSLTNSNVTIVRSTDVNGDPMLEVTVSWTFRTLTDFPGVPSPLNLSRTVRMRVAPGTPKESDS